MGSQNQEKIVADIAENTYFLILADETADMSQIEQLSISTFCNRQYLSS